MSNAWMYINGQFIEEEKGVLPVADLSIQRGYGIFDFLRTNNHIPLYIDDHLARFYHSAQQMRLPLSQPPAAVKEIIHILIRKNNIPYSNIRLSLTGGTSADGYSLSSPNFFITQHPLLATADHAVKLILHEYQRDLPTVKTINYLMGLWLQPLIQEKGADDVLYWKDGLVSECPRSNFFMVTKDDIVVTPASNILKGITRQKLFALASLQIKMEERDITVQELQQAKEAFITSTTKRILPVKQINDIVFQTTPTGSITSLLQQGLQHIEAAYISSYSG